MMKKNFSSVLNASFHNNLEIIVINAIKGYGVIQSLVSTGSCCCREVGLNSYI